jgi:hypothetical protein
MQLATQLTAAAALDVDALVDAQSDEIQGLLDGRHV